MRKPLPEVFYSLKRYCEKEGFKGYDPYDGLNSRLFQAIPWVRSNRFLRLAWIQFFKRSPLNFRPLVGVSKDYNPKALGLFLSGYCLLYKKDHETVYLEKIRLLSDAILELVSKGYSGACWGYNFDWQARAFFQPKFTPTVVATSFVGAALLDAYEITGEKRLLDAARSACDFIMKDLHKTHDAEGDYCYSYSPLDKTVVFNASLLGSRLLSRVYKITGETALRDAARHSVAFCCKHQQQNGAWAYGFLHFHQWVDNFHTGYNLECITAYMENCNDSSFQPVVDKGFDYYRKTFFTEEGMPRYYNDKTYPIDIHATAQMVITYDRLHQLNRLGTDVERVLNWSVDHMFSPRGYFYYQKNKLVSSRISYIRWAQAWMFYALATYLTKKQS